MSIPRQLLLLLTILSAAAQVPEIANVNPPTGRPGDIITIEGQDFDRIGTNNAVYIGNIKARVTQSSVTELKVEVPRGVQAGPITVTAGQLTGSSTTTFQPLFAPFGISTNPCYAYRAAIRATNAFLPLFASADLDGDGAAEMITMTVDRRVRIYQSEPGTHFVTTNSFRLVADISVNTDPGFISPIDFDGDGRIDILITSRSGFVLIRNIHLLGALSVKSFAPPSYETRSIVATSIQVVDLDRDGRPDLLAPEGGTLAIFKNIFDSRNATNTRVFTNAIRFPQLSVRSARAADLNNDGHMEIVTLGNMLNILSHHDRAGILTTASFSQTTISNQNFQNYSSFTLGDVERDGFTDIIANISGREAAVLWNLTRGNHIASNLFPRVSMPLLRITDQFFTTPDDLNGDGYVDLFRTSTLYYPNRTASLAGIISSDSFSTSSPAVGYQSQQPPLGIADVNGDGAPDLVLPPNQNVFYIFENVCSAPLQTSAVLTNRSLQIRSYGLPMDSLTLETTSDFKAWTRYLVVRPDATGESRSTMSLEGRRFFRLVRQPSQRVFSMKETGLAE